MFFLNCLIKVKEKINWLKLSFGQFISFFFKTQAEVTDRRLNKF